MQGLAWRGAKDFNDAYKQTRFERLTKGRALGKDDSSGDEIFSSSHLMHPGALNTGLVSSKYTVGEMNQPYETTAQAHFPDPGKAGERAAARLHFTKAWLEGEVEDAKSVVRRSHLSRSSAEHARRALGLSRGPPVSRAGASARARSQAQFEAQSLAQTLPSQPAARTGGSYAPPRVGAMGTSFVRRPELAYETTHGSAFVSFQSHESRVVEAAARAAENEAVAAAAAAAAATTGSDTGAGVWVTSAGVVGQPTAVPAARRGPPPPLGGWPVSSERLEAVRLGNGALYANPLRDVKYADFTGTLDVPGFKHQASLRPLRVDSQC